MKKKTQAIRRKNFEFSPDVVETLKKISGITRQSEKDIVEGLIREFMPSWAEKELEKQKQEIESFYEDGSDKK